ncbi:MAG TPA: hypothetical protein VHB02_04925 [Acidimicrobiales bacterium]|nr:hypothetical protein [Acidimicrobiales bacterium]
MSIEGGEQHSTPQEDLAAWRGRTEAFLRIEEPGYAHTADGWPVEIDIDDMIGAKGRKLEPTQELRDELNYVIDQPGVHPDPPVTTPNHQLLHEAGIIPSFIRTDFDPPEWAEHVGAVLGPAAARQPEKYIDRLETVIAGLRNPLKVIAFHYLYVGKGTPEAAERVATEFGTSVETVAFLGDVALDIIEAHIRFE